MFGFYLFSQIKKTMSVIAKQSILFAVLFFILRPIMHLLLWNDLEMTELLIQSFATAVVAGLLFFLVLQFWHRKKVTNS